MKFTVYIPMYNAELYIGEAIESVLNQTYNDFELLVINDGSTDNSVEIVKKYEKQNNHIRMISQNNQGLFHARITAFMHARGDYIVAVDADDKLRSDALEKINNTIHSNCTVDLVEFCYRRTNFKTNGKSIHKAAKTYDKNSVYEYYELALWNDDYNSQCTKAIRRDVLIDITEIVNLPRISMGEDKIHTLNYLHKVHNVTVLDDDLYLYRYSEGSMSNCFRQNVFYDLKQIYYAYLRFDKKNVYQIDIKDVSKHISIGIAKALVYTPSSLVGHKGKNVYLEAVEKLYTDSEIMNIVNIKIVPIIYKIPLILLKYHLKYMLLTGKKIAYFFRGKLDKYKYFN